MKGCCIRRQVLYCLYMYLKEGLYSSITENFAKTLMYMMTIASNEFSVYNVMFTRSSRYLNCVRMCNKRKKTISILCILFIPGIFSFLISSSKSVCLHAHVKERMCNKRKKALVSYVSYSLPLLFWYRPLNLFVYMRTSKKNAAESVSHSLKKSSRTPIK